MIATAIVLFVMGVFIAKVFGTTQVQYMLYGANWGDAIGGLMELVAILIFLFAIVRLAWQYLP